MKWNAVGADSAFDMLPIGEIAEFDLIILTETFLTKEWNIPNIYGMHVFATQGQMGRPIGGISCLLK